MPASSVSTLSQRRKDFFEQQRPPVGSRRTLPSITTQARRYALRELARRAGVAREFFETWKIESTSDKTIVSFGPEVGGQLRFPHDDSDQVASQIPLAKVGWLSPPNNTLASADLFVPFYKSNQDLGEPLYRRSDPHNWACRLDLLRSTLFTLSRIEEMIAEPADEHGRFPAASSLAVQHDFIERPILDEHGLALQQVLLRLFPRWQPQLPIFRVKLTHDIDDIGIPFRFRTAIAHTLKRHMPGASVRDFLSNYSQLEPLELTQVRKLAEVSSSRGLHSAFYWKGGGHTPHDSGYDPAHPKVQRVITYLRERGFELGVHPGYQTFRDRARLATEVAYLRQALGIRWAGGRQHYLRWCPATWLDWDACGLAYDSSVGFADRFGFRAGTAFPYRPWSFEHNRELELIEVPLILMDCAPVKYMKLSFSEGLQRIANLIARIKQTGGVFTLLWHNTPLLDQDYEGWYEAILDLLVGAPCFDLPASPEQLW